MCALFAASQQIPTNAADAVRAGTAALEQGDFAVAEQQFSNALKADPSLAEVRANLGLAYYSDHKYPQAVNAFRHALRQQPSLTIPQIFLPLSLASSGQCGEAVSGLERFFPNSPDVHLRRIIGLSLQRCLFQLGENKKADAVTQTLLAQYPDDVDVLYEAGQMYAKLSNQLYLRLMQKAPHSPRGYDLMGQVLETQGDWPRATSAYQKALQLDPRSPGVRLHLAHLLLAHPPDANAWQQAVGQLQQELKLDPGSVEAEYELGEAYRKHGRADDAAAAFRRALQLDPNFVDGRIGLAKVLRSKQQLAEAAAVLEPAEKTEPDNTAVHFLLAGIYRDLGRTEDARREQAMLKPNAGSPE